jgi:hypothetical protein
MKNNYKDFRCGNFVEYDGFVFQIDTISASYPTLNTIKYGIGVVDWSNIKSIPITEEWLLKMGFVKDIQLGYRFDKIHNDFIVITYDLDDNCIRISDTWEFGKRIYVHEIQNLFYALTKEEII